MITLRRPKTVSFSRFIRHMSDNPASRARDQACFPIVSSMQTDYALLDWIPVNICMCAFPLDGSVRVSGN